VLLGDWIELARVRAPARSNAENVCATLFDQAWLPSNLFGSLPSKRAIVGEG